jgi:hypothetical protein
MSNAASNKLSYASAAARRPNPALVPLGGAGVTSAALVLLGGAGVTSAALAAAFSQVARSRAP